MKLVHDYVYLYFDELIIIVNNKIFGRVISCLLA